MKVSSHVLSSKWGCRTPSGPSKVLWTRDFELGDQVVPDCFCVNWSSYKGVQVLTLITALLQKANPFMRQQKANSEHF